MIKCPACSEKLNSTVYREGSVVKTLKAVCTRCTYTYEFRNGAEYTTLYYAKWITTVSGEKATNVYLSYETFIKIVSTYFKVYDFIRAYV